MSNASMDRSLSQNLLNWMGAFLVATIWVSAIIFGLYILAFYALSLINGNYEQWNMVLPGLYDSAHKPATISIGIHFFAGGVILILGCIQLMQGIRQR